MCFGAIYWSRVRTVYYGAERKDAADIGFDDSLIYDEIKKDIDDNTKIVPFEQISREAALSVFKAWTDDHDKTMYWELLCSETETRQILTE